VVDGEIGEPGIIHSQFSNLFPPFPSSISSSHPAATGGERRILCMPPPKRPATNSKGAEGYACVFMDHGSPLSS